MLPPLLLPYGCVALYNQILFSGSKYLNDCPLERMIPIYLIVAGVVGVFLSLTQGRSAHVNHRRRGHEAPQEQDNPKSTASLCGSLITLFALAWFIVGNVYVFRNKANFDANYNNVTSPLWCYPLAYNFAYYSIITHYVIFAFIIVLSCLTCCCAAGFVSGSAA